MKHLVLLADSTFKPSVGGSDVKILGRLTARVFLRQKTAISPVEGNYGIFGDTVGSQEPQRWIFLEEKSTRQSWLWSTPIPKML